MLHLIMLFLVDALINVQQVKLMILPEYLEGVALAIIQLV
jgi:hypothetical protein